MLMGRFFVELQGPFRLTFHELGIINMNNSVSVVAVEDGLERTFGQAVTR